MACKGAELRSWTHNKAYRKSCIIYSIERGTWTRDRSGWSVSLHIGLLGFWRLWDCEVFVRLTCLFHFTRVFAIVFIQDICWYFTFADEVFVNLQAKFNIIFAHIWKPNPVVTYLTFQYTLNTMCFLSNESLTVALYDYILNILFRISFEKYLLAHTGWVYSKVCDYRPY
jgi:hypothetical protein